MTINVIRSPKLARIALLAALSRTTNFSIGCYCADETRCHRVLLREMLVSAGAEVVT